MPNINSRILDDSNFVGDCYTAQTRAFAPAEYNFISELASRNDVKTFLDVGTGNGIFISGLADRLPSVAFDATDADRLLIASALQNNSRSNIHFMNSMFDASFPLQEYDMIHARFAVEHMPDVPAFISEACKRLGRGGLLLITEYYVDDMHSRNPVWKLFRQKEYEFYVKFGSHPRISTELPGFFRKAGLSDTQSVFRHICPSTAGRKEFYDLIKTYAVLYHKLDPLTFSPEIKNKIMDHCALAVTDETYEDGLLISHTTGKKPSR